MFTGISGSNTVPSTCTTFSRVRVSVSVVSFITVKCINDATGGQILMEAGGAHPDLVDRRVCRLLRPGPHPGAMGHGLALVWGGWLPPRLLGPALVADRGHPCRRRRPPASGVADPPSIPYGPRVQGCDRPGAGPRRAADVPPGGATHAFVRVSARSAGGRGVHRRRFGIGAVADVPAVRARQTVRCHRPALWPGHRVLCLQAPGVPVHRVVAGLVAYDYLLDGRGGLLPQACPRHGARGVGAFIWPSGASQPAGRLHLADTGVGVLAGWL